MKKIIVRNLFFVLAFAIICIVFIPEVAAFASASPTLNADTKYLQLSGISGPKKFDFNIQNKEKGWRYVWYSADDDIATVDDNGLTTATGIGTTKITVIIYDKKDKRVKVLKPTVIVRDNIKTLEITNTPIGNVLSVGKENDFNRNYITETGNSKRTTSVTRWFIDKSTATITDAGIFKAAESGTYKITAVVFQSIDDYNEWQALNDKASSSNVIATASYTVTVVKEMASVRQLNYTEAELCFSTAMTEAEVRSKLTVSNVITTSAIKSIQTVKSITMSTDGKIATVEMSYGFVSGNVYQFDFTGMTSLQIIGATADAAEVVDLVISTSSILVNETDEDAEIKIKLLNTNGVDIGSINTDLRSRITLTTTTSSSCYLNTTVIPNRLTFYNAGDTAVIIAEFHTYLYDNISGQEKGIITRAKAITGVTVSSNPASNITAWSISSSTQQSPLASVNHAIAIGDNPANLYVKAMKSDGKTPVSNAYLAGSEGWNFVSSDQNILSVSTAGNQTCTLYPVKMGSAVVSVYYTSDRNKSNSNYTLVGAIPINVGAKRIAAALNLSLNNIILSNTIRFVDSKVVTIEVLDQYGAKMPVSDLRVTEMKNAINGVDPIDSSLISATDTKITFRGASVSGGNPTSKGIYGYMVTANSLTKYITVSVLEPAANTYEASYYKLSTDLVYDEKVTTETTFPYHAKVRIVGYTANGVALESLNPAEASLKNYNVSLGKPDGTTIDLYLDNFDAFYYGYYPINSLSGSKVEKAQQGTYTLKLYKENSVVEALTFVVKDTQPVPSYVINKLETGTSASIEASIQECFTVLDSNGIPVFDKTKIRVEPWDYTVNYGSVLSVTVKNIRYDETIGNYVVTHVIAVNTVITIK